MIQKTEFLNEFTDLLEHTATWTGQLIITGDFNVHWDCETDAERKQLADILESFGMTQHVNGETHIKGHTLDLVMSRTVEGTVASCSISDYISDHNAILVQLTTSRSHPPRISVSTRKVRGIQIPSLDHDISPSSLATALPDDVDRAVDDYNEVLGKLIDKHAPLKTHQVAERLMVPWMNEIILNLKRQRR